MVDFCMDDFWYVDYCTNCRDLDVMDEKEVPCHHPWYCWHDGGEVQELEFKLGVLYEEEYWNKRLNPSEKELFFRLRDRKFKLVHEKLKEYRRS